MSTDATRIPQFLAMLALLMACMPSMPQVTAFQVANPNSKSESYKMYDDSRALLIGISKYRDSSWGPLDTIPKEVGLIKEALLRQGFQENKMQVVISSDGALSGEKLRTIIRSFVVQNVGRDTRMLLFFAGHGWTDGEYTGYLVPANSPSEASPDFKANLVSMSEIVEWSRQSRAKHMLFIFDSCFSGAVFLTRSNLKPNQLFLADADRPVRQFLTSGSATDSVPAKSDFAQKLIEGLNGAADVYPDGVVTANELGYWLKSSITPLGKQTPQYGSSPYSDYRYGDTVFNRLTTDASLQLPQKERSKEMAGTRGSNLSALGEPTHRAQSAFNGLEVIYYEKIGDAGGITRALDAAEIPFSKTRASRPQEEQTNGIACGPKVPIEAVRTLALALVHKGVKLNAIFPYANPSLKPYRLEILTTPQRTGPGLRVWTPEGITGEQIQALAACG